MTEAQQFETFMHQYQNMVFSTAMRLLANPTEAEDISQEVFLKAFERFAELRDSPTVAGWLKTVATNLCLNHLSRYRSRWTFFSDLLGSRAEEQEQPEPDFAAPDALAEQLDQADRHALVERALQALPAAQRIPLVLFQGSAKVLGKVRGDAVIIGGSLDVEGEITGDAVVLGGKVTLHTNAVVDGDVVGLGGKVDIAEGATVRGQVVPISIGLGDWQVPGWVKLWLKECVMKARPLAPGVHWVWAVAGGFWLFYLALAAIFPRPVRSCLDELTERPATTFFMGLLTKLLAPVVLVILLFTGIGLFVIPFVVVALFIGAIFGKLALVEAVGLRIGGQFGLTGLQAAVPAFVLGSVIILLLYMVPVLGGLTYAMLGIWGLGAAVTATFSGLRRETGGAPGSSAPPPEPIGPENASASAPGSFGLETGTWANASLGGVATATAPVAPALVPDILAYPKAGLWERLGAAFLDLVLLGVISAFTGGPPLGFLIALAYFAGMWTWKGTTIGGIVLGLKLVRLDGQPVNFAVALVRALAAAFSTIVFFLGFLWIAWDDEKQGWHDKIAGTVVLRLPKATPLLCA